MANYQHGLSGSVKVGGSAWCVTSWNLDDTCELADVTTSCSSGYREFIPGLKSASGSFTAPWDLNANPYATPPALKKGSLVSLELHVSTSSYWAFSAYIESVNVTVDVGDVIKYTVNFKSTGAITEPV